MEVSRFKRVFCLLLAVLTLAASSHYRLCAAGLINCPPCQTEGNDEDDCYVCLMSSTLAKASEASAAFTVPVAVFVLPSFDFTSILLDALVGPVPQVNYPERVIPPPHDFLRALTENLPIRGPSFTA